MIYNPKFDDIRPYREEEIPAAMQRIAASSFFPMLAEFVHPQADIEQSRALVAGLQTVYDFQSQVMSCFNEQVIARSTDEFTCTGWEGLCHDKHYLFVSNHRDIVLDSSLLQYVLFKHGMETTEITFGANLMCTPLVIDIGKSNKMFRVERGGNMKDFYRSSIHLSEYIRHVLTEKGQSVWIAQRNGRTKDGIDMTDQGIIKMFCMSRPDDKIAALAELNIVPVAVSYEWEPCDILKALELYNSRFEKYVKKPGEDLNSILTGIMQPKGRVHIEICPPLTQDDLMAYDHCTHNEYHKEVATLLDRNIHKHYRLMPNNYIAHDLRYGQRHYASLYTETERRTFIERLRRLDDFEVSEPDVLKDIFLGIYANPVEHRD